MELNNEKKTDVVIRLLDERCNAAHRMRERSQSFTIWILGLGIALGWKILDDNTGFSFFQKALLTIFVLVLSETARKYVAGIEAGFNKNREILIKLEKLLGLYTEGFFLKEGALFPNEYSAQINKETSHFCLLGKLLLTLEWFLIIFIWSTEILNLLKLVICC